MTFAQILYEVADQVATITLNRPDRLNAWTHPMTAEVRRAAAAAAADDAVRVVVITGAGRGFCSGADVDQLGTDRDKPYDQRPRPPELPPFDRSAPVEFHGRYSFFPAVPKPVIAAINGPAAGLGLIIALYCDLRFAAEEAVFTTAFARRGLIAEHGMSWLLPRLVGPANAFDLLFSARKFGAAEALHMGLVNRVVPGAELMAAVRAYAADLAAQVSPRSLAVIKRQIWEAQVRPTAEAVAVAEEEMRLSFQSEDFREGVSHFVEGRPPAFTGR